MAANAKALAKYGGRFLARGGKVEAEGRQAKIARGRRGVPSYRAALECYRSPEYVSAMKEREARSVWDMAITEEGPQPRSK